MVENHDKECLCCITLHHMHTEVHTLISIVMYYRIYREVQRVQKWKTLTFKVVCRKYDMIVNTSSWRYSAEI
jgi:hypothetical protein